MSSSWAAPDRRPPVAALPAFGEPPAAAPEDPPVHREVVAAAVTAVAVLLCGPVVGLLWAALAPRPDLVVEGAEVYPRDQETSAFIAVDGVFLAGTALAGILTGLTAWRLARRYGLGAVVGLLIGGLAAAALARVVGEAVGTSFDDLIQRPGAAGELGAGPEVPSELSFRLRSPEAMVGWPVGAMVSFVVASVLGARFRRGRPDG